MDKKYIAGLYLMDNDFANFEITIPEGNPAELVDKLGLLECVLKVSNERCPNDGSDYFIHVLLTRATFEDGTEFEIGIWARKNCPGKLHPKLMKEIILFKSVYEYVEPNICRIWYPTELCTDRADDIDAFFDSH